jgi:hypothetical protein
MRNKDKIAEGYYPMGKKASYSDAVPSVKIVIEHSRVIEEGEQRYRNINRIFLENQLGERYLLDTKKPGIARVYARHIAEGGKVNDDRWSHIGNLCEEYQKMAGFVRATRNGQFNESAQSLVNEGIAHYASLRESLSRMTGKRGYNAYFENWTPSLMEDGTEENNLNELFVQETLDPRIESVMPILNRIHKKVAESIVDKEMNKLAEWADSLTEEESLTSNNPVGIPESEGRQEIGQMMADDGITYSAEKENEIISKMVEYMKKSGMDSKQIRYLLNYDEDYIADQLSYLPKEGMDESALQAYLGNKKYGKDGMDALRKAGREHAGKEKMQNIRAKYSDNEEVAEEVDTGEYDARKSTHKGQPSKEQEKSFREKVQAYGKELEKRQKEQGVAEGSVTPDITVNKVHDDGHEKEWHIYRGKEMIGYVLKNQPDTAEGLYIAYGHGPGRAFVKEFAGLKPSVNYIASLKEGVAEDLDANQKRVGQLGPTEKVGKKGAVGKLVGANENFINQADQAVVSEEDAVAEGILDSIKNMFKPKDPTTVTPVTSVDIVTGYKTDPEFKAQIDQIAKQQGMTPQALIAHIKQGLDAGADVIGVGEGTHTQHDRDLNPNDYERNQTDFSRDPIAAGTDRIHDKIKSMLGKLKKPASSPLDKRDTDIGSVLEAALPWEDDEEDKDDKKPKDTKGSDGSEHGGHSRAKHLAKNAIPKEKEEVNEMDKSQTPPGRDGGPREGPEKIAKPITKEKMVKHASDILSKSMAKKDDKKDVKEGQDDLDAILRIIRK